MEEPENRFSFPLLLAAYQDCRKGKNDSASCQEFEFNREKELLTLSYRLQAHTYRPGRSRCFVVEKPKLREIFAAGFRDRVVHHLLFNYLNPIFEPKFVFHSFACRKGKGTLAAARALQKLLLKATPPTG